MMRRKKMPYSNQSVICSKGKRMKRILVPVLFLSFVACHKQIDLAKFDPVYRAAKALQAATEAGVEYEEFTQKVEELATELSAVENKIDSENSKEVALGGQYKKILETYRDSRELWKLENEDTASDRFHPGKLNVGDRRGRVLSPFNSFPLKYGIKIEEVRYVPPESERTMHMKPPTPRPMKPLNSPWGSTGEPSHAKEEPEQPDIEIVNPPVASVFQVIDADEALQKIWEHADRELEGVQALMK
jgi:hypothetical protein